MEKAKSIWLNITPPLNPYSSMFLSPGRGVQIITSPSSCRSRVIASKDFGFALDIFFCRMMANNVSHMSAILYIDNHTLSVRLRIKQSAYGQLNYVVSVYDPNDTNVAVRGTHRTARAFSLDKFISSGPDAQTSGWYVCSQLCNCFSAPITWGSSRLFSRVLHHECHLPLYIHRQCC